MTREQGLRIAAYVRVDPDDATEDGGFWHSPAGELQIEAIETWARANGHTVTNRAVERTCAGIDHISERVGFLSAVTQVRDGEADLVCVAALERLDDDLVMQELLLWEARRSHVVITSANTDEHDQLRDHPLDPARALVRRAIEQTPAFQGELRSLRAGVRRLESEDGLDQLAPAISELESMQAHGTPDGSSQLRQHRIARWLRSRRTAG